ncbi:MAG: hypothetical protein M0C28_44155 [Candidatus Moduliflexus flocculans]|nr:hypothetical protein [Candidatus Moduliflexus flocculans]
MISLAGALGEVSVPFTDAHRSGGSQLRTDLSPVLRDRPLGRRPAPSCRMGASGTPCWTINTNSSILSVRNISASSPTRNWLLFPRTCPEADKRIEVRLDEQLVLAYENGKAGLRHPRRHRRTTAQRHLHHPRR